MDDQQTKPARKWRGYLKEYVIIVVGVLTALGAQQAADWWRWQGEVKAARQTIHAEMAFNNGFYARRIAVSACTQKQITEAARIMDDLEAGRPTARFTVFQEGMGASLQDNEWQSERAAQSLTHFPRAELALMSKYYTAIGNAVNWMQNESEAWRALSVLRRPPKEMPVTDLLRLRTALQTVIVFEGQIASSAQLQLRRSNQLGIETPPADTRLVEKFCTSNYDEYRSYARSLVPSQ